MRERDRNNDYCPYPDIEFETANVQNTKNCLYLDANNQ